MAYISTRQIAYGLGHGSSLGTEDGNVLERVVHDSGRHLGISAVLGTVAATLAMQATEKPDRTQTAAARLGIGLGASAIVPTVVNGIFEVIQNPPNQSAVSRPSHFSWEDVLVGGGVAGALPVLLGGAFVVCSSSLQAVRGKHEGLN